jgi:Gpi18-like mannosyltransferase
MREEGSNTELLFKIGIFFRLLFLFSIPNLSQDFYRFIWDGRMLINGLNPYLYLPDEIVKNKLIDIPEAVLLYNGMGSLSSGHYTNYPPVNQLCFALAALGSGKSIFGSVFILRILIIVFDLGIYTYGRKLLHALKIPENNIFFYFLNPLVIIELTGNLHFEGAMIFFLVLALYQLQIGKYLWAAVLVTLSISMKLIPLMLLPLFIKYLGIKKAIIFFTIVGIMTLILFLPFFSILFLNNYLATIALWFVNFEFNASIYYIIRSIGYNLTGYNIIHITGKVIPFILIIFILYISFKKQDNSLKNLITNMLIVLSIYFFLSTTIHPWYIVSLVMLSVFTNWKFPVVWSFTIILSYFSYINPVFQENNLILTLEYVIVYGYLVIELLTKKLYEPAFNPSHI